ncbi:UMP-CMP kinase 2, mitochondrial-like [Amphiura filiformis]|uniref:UMP-CMP kinase 2, mitochondrial-like n=1 Tax=Amphiura filiformis TaxID=82378 RepID=UPI003B21A945
MKDKDNSKFDVEIDVTGEADDDDVDWLECISAIETPKGVLYFCDSAYFAQAAKSISKLEDSCIALESGNQGDQLVVDNPASCQDRRISKSIPSFISRFSHGVCLYSITGYNPLNIQQDSVENHFCNQSLLQDLRDAFPDSEILKNFSYFPRKPNHFERGFTIMVPIGHPTNQEATVYRLAMKYKQAAYFVCEIEETGEHRQKLVLLLGEKPEVVEESLVVLERLSYHPAYLHRDNNSVFHRFEDAMDILSKCAHFPETQELFHIAKHSVLRTESSTNSAMAERHPVIAMEGISEAGITKQSKQLSESLGAQRIQSPPTCIQHLRQTFDKQNDLVRAAFYSVGNYIVSAQMQEMAQKSPVIVDRYWNSTVAFTIVSEVGTGASNLPPKNHFVYEWPSDLPKPDTVVFIGSKREMRKKSKVKGQCEKGQQAKQMILETFRRMKMSDWIEVDRCKDKCWSSDAITAVTIDKLSALNLISLDQSSGDSLCPAAATLHPSKVHDVIHVEVDAVNGVGKDDIPFL